jgi:hypothetical protein
MKGIDAAGFDERMAKCAPDTRDLIGFLMVVAQNAGVSVAAPTFEVRGIGITYWTNECRFCRFDPKHQADHVWALIPNADRHALGEAGVVSDREDGPWVTIKNMRGAVRLVPHVLHAYDRAQR